MRHRLVYGGHVIAIVAQSKYIESYIEYIGNFGKKVVARDDLWGRKDGLENALVPFEMCSVA